MNKVLRTTSKQLRLLGLVESLEIRLLEAAGHGLSRSEFLEFSIKDELAVRVDRQFQRRFKAADFPERKSLENVDWCFNPSIPSKQVFDLASRGFLREERDVLWLDHRGWGRVTWCKRDRLPGRQSRVHGPISVGLLMPSRSMPA
jgi:IstB-like ATP binding protein